MQYEIDDFVQHTSNTLQGFFTVYIPEFGVSIPGFTFHRNASGAKWVEFPAKQNKNREWERVIVISETRKAKKFKEQLLKLLEEFLKNDAEEYDIPEAVSQQQ